MDGGLLQVSSWSTATALPSLSPDLVLFSTSEIKTIFFSKIKTCTDDNTNWD